MGSNQEFDYCVNCSSHLTNILIRKCGNFPDSSIKIREKTDSTPDMLDTISSLSTLYKLNYLDYLKFTRLESENSSEFDDDAWKEEMELCGDCKSVLFDAYRFYEQFNRMRLENSFLSRVIQKLDNLMESLETTFNGHSAVEVKKEEDGSSDCDDPGQNDLNDHEFTDKQEVGLEEPECKKEEEMRVDDCQESLSNLTNYPIVLLTRLPDTAVPTRSEKNSVIRDYDPVKDESSSDDPSESSDQEEKPVARKQQDRQEPVADVNSNGQVFCRLCGPERIFKNKNSLYNHRSVSHNPAKPKKGVPAITRRKKVDSDGSFFCGICGPEKIFKTLNSLYNHRSTYHNSSGKDRIAKKKIKTAKLKAEKKSKNAEPITDGTCPLCQKQFKMACNLTLHLLGHYKDESRLGCPIPSCKFHHKTLIGNPLSDHIKSHTGDLRHGCPLPECQQMFLRKPDLGRHFQKHWKIGVYICDKCFESLPSQSELENHVSRMHVTVLKCPLCPQLNFKTEALHLVTHLQSEHPNQKLYKCPTCNDTFRLPRLLTAHIDRNHRKYYKCDGCEVGRFRTQSRLDQHKERCKGINRSHQCPDCPRVFSSKYVLEGHKQTHLSDSPGFKCIVESCGKLFYNPAALKNHSRTHLKDRPFICHICGMSFSQQNKLNGHMIVHSEERNFMCSDCGKCYKSAGLLTSHSRVHGSQSFSCSDCDKLFKYPGSLRLHYRTEHQPALTCPVCNAGFPFNFHLKKHLAQKHPEYSEK